MRLHHHECHHLGVHIDFRNFRIQPVLGRDFQRLLPKSWSHASSKGGVSWMQLNKLFQYVPMFLSPYVQNYIHVFSSHILNEADPSKLKHNGSRQCARRRTVGWGSRSKIVAVPWSLRIISVYSLPIILVSYCSRSKPFNVLQREVKTKCLTTSTSISPHTNSACPSPMCEDNHVTGQIEMLRVSVTVSKTIPCGTCSAQSLLSGSSFK